MKQSAKRAANTAQHSLARRDFLKKAAVAGVAIGASRAAVGAPNDDTHPTETSPAHGYRETAHVRRYYRLARF